jgi:hypothetical protein
MALTRLGARRWVKLIAIAWRLCSIGTAPATGVATFVIARFLLALQKTGFFLVSPSS